MQGPSQALHSEFQTKNNNIYYFVVIKKYYFQGLKTLTYIIGIHFTIKHNDNLFKIIRFIY